MGMYASLYRVGVGEVAWIRENPREVPYEVLGFERPKPRTGGIMGFLKRLSPLTITTTSDEEPSPVATSAHAALEAIDLEKAWHGLHFLFTGETWEGDEPACFLLKGGEDVGEDEWSEPVARLLSPPQVRAFADFLETLGPTGLTARFDPQRMTELDIYPGPIWERDDREESIGFLLAYFEELRAFASRAADAGDAVLVHVS